MWQVEVFQLTKPYAAEQIRQQLYQLFLEQAQVHARKCLKEIEATPQEAWLRPMSKLARFIYTRSYEAELDINLDKNVYD